MTVIAWDGATLAADRRCSDSAGMMRSVQKLERFTNGSVEHLLAMTGSWDSAVELREWFKAGAEPEKFPAECRKDIATLIVLSKANGGPVQIASYASGPFPLILFPTPSFASWGSGRDFATMAMHLGVRAEQAVLATTEFQVDCGHGVDTMQFSS